MLRVQKWVRMAVLVGIGLLLANAAFPPPLDKAYNTSVLVTDKQGQWLSAYSVEDGRWRIKAAYDDIDSRFIAQLIAIEDKRFYRHSGVDPIAVLRAIRSWGREGRAVSGASTLTMQLVRKLEPRPRTLRSKMIETIRAVQIEMRLSKREILELYLTHTPYGGNIEGIAAASRIYFDKSPRQLTDAQIALLIALPQSPEARRPDRHPKIATQTRNEILQKVHKVGLLSDIQYREAKEERVSSKKYAFPNLAWLTGNKLKSHVREWNTKIISSLDTRIQSDVARLATSYTYDKSFNVAVLVIDNKTMKVRAHLGSAGRDRPGGWIDMTDRPRSPGSTLKPFIYGFAFDDGLSAPGSFILDAPTRFGSYQPENFDRRYHGQVRIFEALGHSLNVPAVIALDKVGTDRFAAALNLTGAKIVKPTQLNSETGLALALGGAGMTVEDLAILYAALANEGHAKPLVWLEQGGKCAQAYQLMSPSSARKITDILRQAPTPDGRVPHWLTRKSHDIAYKTGTSYGFRDAWAAGYTDAWTVIVWVGRPDGAPRVGKTGRQAAAPLLFDVFSNLGNTAKDRHYQKMDTAPRGLQIFGGHVASSPEILFPPDGAELAVSAFGAQGHGLTFAARSNTGAALHWYVDGRPVSPQASSGKSIWHPQEAGFYKVSVVDHQGASSHARVRVMAFD
ncbi:MAG: penicillin-binding protein 1C [Robiginitomaculum sp.]|nr:MAG: penicillin-binding protein 1C [Robiginitomaculum sp.]